MLAITLAQMDIEKPAVLDAFVSIVDVIRMSTDDESCPLKKLVDTFHSLLDESLIYAIANDFDLDKASGYDGAYAILKDLSQSVPSEEESGFDPSASHCFAAGGETEAGGLGVRDGSISTPTAPSERDSAFQDHRTDSSSTSNAASIEAESGNSSVDLFQGHSEEYKIQQLRGLFPDVKAYDVEHSLKRAKGDFETALDDLLNIQYLQSTGQRSKGIDIFFDDDAPIAGSKKKPRGRSGNDRSTDTSRGDSAPLEDPDEFKFQSKIRNLADWFNISFDEMSVLYYRADCSVIDTVLGVLDDHISRRPRHPSESSKEEVVLVDGLRAKYRNIPDRYLEAIVQRTRGEPFFMDDIGTMMNKHFKQNKKQRVDTGYTLMPLPAEKVDSAQCQMPGRNPRGGDWTLVSSRTTSSASASASASSSSSSGPQNYAQAVERMEAYDRARRDAASSAASLYKKGASNPLYRQAASVYAARASEQAGYAQGAMSTAADLLVEGKSTEDSIDLHGVSVQDGVRIARQRASHWWETRGKFRGERKEMRTLTIITGLGRHNASGVSQLRQTVAKALVQDGWRMEVETGRFVITGRR